MIRGAGFAFDNAFGSDAVAVVVNAGKVSRCRGPMTVVPDGGQLGCTAEVEQIGHVVFHSMVGGPKPPCLLSEASRQFNSASSRDSHCRRQTHHVSCRGYSFRPTYKIRQMLIGHNLDAVEQRDVDNAHAMPCPARRESDHC